MGTQWSGAKCASYYVFYIPLFGKVLLELKCQAVTLNRDRKGLKACVEIIIIRHQRRLLQELPKVRAIIGLSPIEK